ncbi:MAG TPA: FAD-dependent oxidoreductase [Albitalea sp.]|jgi:thioredoxin reductase|nr:FAD-dependent oxidoreductase [Albitalea sp.]
MAKEGGRDVQQTARRPARAARQRSTIRERGFIKVDKQMRTDVPQLFAIGDIGESIGMTDQVFEGVCTDLPPQKKK